MSTTGKNTPTGIAILFVLAGLAGPPACRQAEPPVDSPPPPEVTVATPTVQAVTNYLNFTGITAGSEIVEVRPMVSGYLDTVLFTEGVLVNENDPLFKIDPRLYQAAVDEAAATLQQRQAEAELADVTYQRAKRAFDLGAVSDIELLENEAKRDVAAAVAESAKSRLDAAKLNLEFTDIHSPISGRVGRTQVDKGNLVGPSDPSPLTSIVRMQPIYVNFDLSERELLPLMRQKQDENNVRSPGPPALPIELGLADTETYEYEGVLDFGDNRISTDTGTIQLRATFPNDDHFLIDGMFVRLRLPMENIDDALLIPDVAIGSDQRGKYVYVINADDEVVYTPVETAQLIEGRRVITEGIAPGDRVVVDGFIRCRPGLVVDPIPAKAAAE